MKTFPQGKQRGLRVLIGEKFFGRSPMRQSVMPCQMKIEREKHKTKEERGNDARHYITKAIMKGKNK